MTIDEFKQIELRIAKVIASERVPGSDKLIKLQVSLGDSERQIIAGVGKAYEPESLIGKEIVIVANLDPRQMMGLESRGMLLAATGSDGMPVIITPEKEVEPGSKIS